MVCGVSGYCLVISGLWCKWLLVVCGVSGYCLVISGCGVSGY